MIRLVAPSAVNEGTPETFAGDCLGLIPQLCIFLMKKRGLATSIFAATSFGILRWLSLLTQLRFQAFSYQLLTIFDFLNANICKMCLCTDSTLRLGMVFVKFGKSGKEEWGRIGGGGKLSLVEEKDAGA